MMRTTFGSALLGSLLLMMLAFGVPERAAAQTLAVGACTAATEDDFSPGLGALGSQQHVSITTIFFGCNFLTNPAPVNFRWSGTIDNAGCTAISSQVPVGTGLLTWQNGQTSTLAFTSLTYATAGVAVPAILTFTITDGYNKGGSLQATTAFLPSPYQVLQCLTSQPVTVLTGSVPTVTFININL